MTNPAPQIVCVGRPAVLAEGEFALESCESLDAAAQRLRGGPHDGLLIQLDNVEALDRLAHWSALSHAVLDAAVVVVAPEVPVDAGLSLLRLGVQDVVPADEASPQALARRMRHAIERKRVDEQARRGAATDVSTGLPTHSQLLEHITHLLALREREPAPMALVALRIDGLATTEATLGVESANVLRRKVAVRLRSVLRASDVVASIGRDAFAVLLAWIDAPHDGERVAAKLAASLRQPFNVAGRHQAVAVSVGLALYPEHGRNADALLRRAIGQAAEIAAIGREGFANRVERGPSAAANDPEAEG